MYIYQELQHNYCASIRIKKLTLIYYLSALWPYETGWWQPKLTYSISLGLNLDQFLGFPLSFILLHENLAYVISQNVAWFGDAQERTLTLLLRCAWYRSVSRIPSDHSEWLCSINSGHPCPSDLFLITLYCISMLWTNALGHINFFIRSTLPFTGFPFSTASQLNEWW